MRGAAEVQPSEDWLPGRDDEITLEDTPDVYASTARGRCLEPEYHDGDCIVFSKTERPRAGDFVGIWFASGVAPPGQPSRWVKRLVYGLPPEDFEGCGMEPLIVVEMLNPPKQFSFPASKILAVHKVLGTATPDGKGMAAWHPTK